MQVKIQGTIVSPDYDDDFFAAWIARGIITPSSRVVSALEAATEPVDLYVNSYGGDVFAGGEMLIALQKCKTRKCLASVEVGSIAASMAANIVAALKAMGVKVTAHSNSQLMFHGCYTSTEGGAQHHEDVAESLRNINDSVISNLNALGITDCHAWFNEGREKWIGADEGLKLNLFDEIAEQSADAPAEARQTAARLAAFASSVMSRMEYKMEIDTTIKAVEESPAEAAPVAPAAEPVASPATEPTPDTASQPASADSPATQSEETPATEATPAAPPPNTEPVSESSCDDSTTIDAALEELAASLANERFAALQSKHDQMISDLKSENSSLKAELAKANAAATTLADRLAKSEADLADLRNQLTAEKAAHESVVASALRPCDTTPADAWATAYRAASASGKLNHKR